MWTSTSRMTATDRGKALLSLCFLLALAGCVSLPTRPVARPSPSPGEGLFLAEAVPVEQRAYQCGPAALESVLRYWGVEADASTLAGSLSSGRARGVLNIALAQQMKERGFWTQMESSDLRGLEGWIRKGIPPIVALHVGPFGMPLYHFAVVTGFDNRQGLLYLNAGRSTTEVMTAAQFDARWGRAGRWALIVCPPERVAWPLNGRQAAEMGLLFERRSDWESARRWYRTAAEQEPDNPAVRFNLANVHLKRGELQEARALYEELAPRHPSWGALQNNLAWTRLSQGDPRGAAETILLGFRHGARARPELLDTLGLAYCRLGECRRARACFRSAAARAPPGNTPMLRQIRLHWSECEPAVIQKSFS